MSPSLVLRAVPAGLGHAAAHEAEEVEHGVGQEAGLAVVDERDGVFALGDLRLVDVAEQRHVPESGGLPSEGFVEQDVLGGGADPLFGADDVGDVHEVVVDDIRKMVGGEAVGLHEDLVVDVEVVEGDVAAEFVAEGGLAFAWDLHADGEGFVFAEIRVDFGRRGGGRGRGTWGELGGGLLLSRLPVLRRCKAPVGVAVLEKEIGVFAVDFGAFGLAVGA